MESEPGGPSHRGFRGCLRRSTCPSHWTLTKRLPLDGHIHEPAFALILLPRRSHTCTSTLTLTILDLS